MNLLQVLKLFQSKNGRIYFIKPAISEMEHHQDSFWEIYFSKSAIASRDVLALLFFAVHI
jgi:hypothetical protein